MPKSIPAPSWLSSPNKPAGGQDFLALRAAPQRLGYALMDGITTVTPHVRYLALRMWILDAYWRQRRPDASNSFRAFAQRVESAIVLGNLLVKRQGASLVGSTQGTERLAGKEDPVSLDPVVLNPAAGIYAGASTQLGLETSVVEGAFRPVPAPTHEAGGRLARLVDGQLRATRLGHLISSEGPPECATLADLMEFGTAAHLDRGEEAECDALIDAILPLIPLPDASHWRRAKWRMGTYATLLAMTGDHGPPSEAAVFATAREGGSTLPASLSPVLDGWALFGAQDLLVSVHEATMAAITNALSDLPEGDDISASRLLEDLLGEERPLDEALTEFELLRSGEHYADLGFRTLAERVEARTTEGTFVRGGVRRWHGGLSERAVGDLAISRARSSAALALLPVAWLLSVRRVEPSLGGQGPMAAHLRGGRLSLTTKVAPQVSRWLQEDTPLPALIARMANTTVGLHLDVAWTRMQENPNSDAAHLYAEGERWRFRAHFQADHAPSRLVNATRWTVQLGLAGPNGLTSKGKERLALAVDLLTREPLT